MAMYKNKTTGYWAEAGRAIRLNSDGTIPTDRNLIGFTGVADLTPVLVLNIASMTVGEETQDIDFTAVVDQAATTIDEFVTAFNLVFTDWTASNVNDRLKIVYSGAGGRQFNFQVTGPLAPVADFGQAWEFGGHGLEFVEVKDDLETVTSTNNQTEDNEVSLEAVDGTFITIVEQGKITGANVSMVLIKEDWKANEVMTGAEYMYSATLEVDVLKPISHNQKGGPKFMLEYWVPMFKDGRQEVSNVTGYRLITLLKCQGKEGEGNETADLKALNKQTFEIYANTQDWQENGVDLTDVQDYIYQWVGDDPDIWNTYVSRPKYASHQFKARVSKELFDSMNIFN